MGLTVQFQVYGVLLGEETIQVSAKSVSNLLGIVILFHIWYTVKVKNKIKIGPNKNWSSDLSWGEKDKSAAEAEQLE